MDYYELLLAKKLNGGGGGEATLIDKNISSNGTYNASSDSADGYKKVVVSVPNTYVAGDEGKVVSSGALVSQSSATYTSNNTYDTTLINSVTVNVSGGSSVISLLNTITVSEDVRAITMDLSSYSAIYDFIFVFIDFTLTGNDYLDVIVNGGSTKYSCQAENHKGIVLMGMKNTGLTISSNVIVSVDNNYSAIANVIANSLELSTYNASKSIMSGSSCSIYGGNYADM